MLLTLCPLMEKAPWVRKRRGEFEKFEKNEWKIITEDELGRLPKLSVQLWLTIYNLVMDGQCRSRYEMKSHRKENLLKLRRFLNEVGDVEGVLERRKKNLSFMWSWYYRTTTSLCRDGTYHHGSMEPAPPLVGENYSVVLF